MKELRLTATWLLFENRRYEEKMADLKNGGNCPVRQSGLADVERTSEWC